MPKAMKLTILNQIYIVPSKHKNSGFTLTELLVAIVITGILVAGSSVGLNTILQKNARNERQTLRRQEINRALSFIAEETKMARNISNDPNNDIPEGSEISSSTASNAETILVLNIPSLADSVVYRIAEPNTNSVWQGPRVVYRWGPNIKKEGNYSDPEDSSGWQNRLVVDFITDSAETNLSNYCNNEADTILPPSQEGFYICLEGNRTAEVVLRGSQEDIKTRVKAFARSNQ